MTKKYVFNDLDQFIFIIYFKIGFKYDNELYLKINY